MFAKGFYGTISSLLGKRRGSWVLDRGYNKYCNLAEADRCNFRYREEELWCADLGLAGGIVVAVAIVIVIVIGVEMTRTDVGDGKIVCGEHRGGDGGKWSFE